MWTRGWRALLLIKAGDLETNPGPTTTHKQVWIYDICHKQINDRKQIFIRCNMIEQWVQLRCAAIRQSQYIDTWTCHLHRESGLTKYLILLLMVSHCLLIVNDYYISRKHNTFIRAVYTQANSLDLAQKNANAYVQPISYVVTVTPISDPDDNTYPYSEAPDAFALAVVYPKRTCYLCGGAPHNILKCEARE